MRVGMASQVAVDLGLQFLGVGALEGFVIVYGSAQNTVEYMAHVIPNRVQMIVNRYSLVQYGEYLVVRDKPSFQFKAFSSEQ